MDRLEVGRLGSGVIRDSGGKYGTHVRKVSLQQHGGGFPRAQGEVIPQPGALGETTSGGILDYGEVKGWGVPAGGHVPQDRPAYLGSSPLEAPRGLHTDSAQFGDLQRQAICNGASGHHQHNGRNCCETSVWDSGSSKGVFDHPTTLAAVVWGGKYEAQADCREI